MNYWLMKSEPEAFSIADLKKLYPQTEPWDGIRNYQVRNMIRDDMQVGDKAFFYHSNCQPPGIVGEMEIISPAYADTTAFDPDSKYYDSKSQVDKPRWFCVDVRFVRQYANILPLEQLKNEPRLADLPIVRKGNRLSIVPVSAKQWQIIQQMAG